MFCAWKERASSWPESHVNGWWNVGGWMRGSHAGLPGGQWPTGPVHGNTDTALSAWQRRPALFTSIFVCDDGAPQAWIGAAARASSYCLSWWLLGETASVFVLFVWLNKWGFGSGRTCATLRADAVKITSILQDHVVPNVSVIIIRKICKRHCDNIL